MAKVILISLLVTLSFLSIAVAAPNEYQSNQYVWSDSASSNHLWDTTGNWLRPSDGATNQVPTNGSRLEARIGLAHPHFSYPSSLLTGNRIDPTCNSTVKIRTLRVGACNAERGGNDDPCDHRDFWVTTGAVKLLLNEI